MKKKKNFTHMTLMDQWERLKLAKLQNFRLANENKILWTNHSLITTPPPIKHSPSVKMPIEHCHHLHWLHFSLSHVMMTEWQLVVNYWEKQFSVMNETEKKKVDNEYNKYLKNTGTI